MIFVSELVKTMHIHYLILFFTFKYTEGNLDDYFWFQDDNVYFYSIDGKVWGDASRDCKNKGGYLVSINSAPENITINQQLLKMGFPSKTFWIGLNIRCDGTSCVINNWEDETDVSFVDWSSSSYPRVNIFYNAVYKAGARGWVNTAPYNTYRYLCEITNKCRQRNPCMHNGNCSMNRTDYQCECLNGRTGKDCENCQPGFTGELCDTEFDECESNPCPKGYKCVDRVGYYDCYETVNENTTGEKKWDSATIVIVVFAFIIMLGILACLILLTVVQLRNSNIIINSTTKNKESKNCFSNIAMEESNTRDDVVRRRKTPGANATGTNTYQTLSMKAKAQEKSADKDAHEIYENV